MGMAKWIGLTFILVLIAVVVAIMFQATLKDRYNSAGSADNDFTSGKGQGLGSNLVKQPVKNNGPSVPVLSLGNSKAHKKLIDFSLIVLSAQDQKAIVLTKEGKTKLLKIGDRIGEAPYEVLQITSKKLVLKQPTNDKILWMFEGEEGKSGRIQEFSSQIDNNEVPSRSAESLPLDPINSTNK